MKKTIYLKEIDEPIWLEFQRHAKEGGSSASKKIMEFIRRCCKPSYDALLRKSPYNLTKEQKEFIRAFEGKPKNSKY